MNINLIYKNFKKENQYADRGNFAAVDSFAEAIKTFKRNVSDLNLRNLKQINDLIKSFQPGTGLTFNDGVRLKDLVGAFKINKVSSVDLSFDDIKEPCVNWCYVQNPKHRGKVEAMVGSDSENTIIFDRAQNSENFTNGFNFAKKYNKKFIPRYFGKSYKSEFTYNKTIGVYLRPDVCPIQVNNILRYFENLHAYAKEYNLVNSLPTLILYGANTENLDYPRFAHTTNREEFFEEIDCYLYSPMEIEDPVHNTLVEAIVSKIPILILKPNDIQNYPGYGTIEEFKEYNKIFIKPLYKYLNFTFKKEPDLSNSFFKEVKPDEFSTFFLYFKKIKASAKCLSNKRKSPIFKLVLDILSIGYSKMIALSENLQIIRLLRQIDSKYTFFENNKQVLDTIALIYVFHLFKTIENTNDYNEKIDPIANEGLIEIYKLWLKSGLLQGMYNGPREI